MQVQGLTYRWGPGYWCLLVEAHAVPSPTLQSGAEGLMTNKREHPYKLSTRRLQ